MEINLIERELDDINRNYMQKQVTHKIIEVSVIQLFFFLLDVRCITSKPNGKVTPITGDHPA